MTKTQLVDLFGTQAAIARIVGVTRSSVCDWPEEIPPRLANEIVGAALHARKFRYRELVKIFPEYRGAQ